MLWIRVEKWKRVHTQHADKKQHVHNMGSTLVIKKDTNQNPINNATQSYYFNSVHFSSNEPKNTILKTSSNCQGRQHYKRQLRTFSTTQSDTSYYSYLYCLCMYLFFSIFFISQPFTHFFPLF